MMTQMLNNMNETRYRLVYLPRRAIKRKKTDKLHDKFAMIYF